MSDGPDSCYNLTARRNARSLTRLYDRHLAPAGLSSSQFSILAVIRRTEGASIAELAQAMVMERTTLMRAMTRLETDGLIERRQSDQHRGLSLSLSEAGREKLKSAAPYWHQAQQAYETRVGKDRAASLRDAILEIGFDA
jgi:DNA-binding MarR family transcriptional regulator